MGFDLAKGFEGSYIVFGACLETDVFEVRRVGNHCT